MNFPIETLRAERVPVILTGGGREYEGVLFGHDKKGRAIWMAVTPRGLSRVRPAAVPETWRPIDTAAWIGDLPDPVASPRPAALQEPVPSAPEGWVPADGWPVPGLRLGSAGERPQSAAELEARVLRGLRTERSPGVVRRDRLGYGSNWPATLTEWADLISQAEGFDHALHATRSAWRPDRRDLGDWHVALGWLAALREPRQRPHQPNRFQKVMIWRSLDPPWSWRSIADKVGREPEMVRGWYDEAIARMWEGL